jgi:hypothetical protein
MPLPRARLLPLLAAAALACATAAPRPTHAAGDAPTKQERARAAELKQQGDEAMVSLRYADALGAYSQSYYLVSDPALLYNKGRALQALGRYPEALENFEAFDAQASAKLKARVPALKELIAEVRAKVSILTLDCSVEGARVMINNKVVATTPLSAPLKLNAGPAVLEVDADGYIPFRKRLSLPGGGEITIRAKLAARSTMSVLVVDSPVAGARVTVNNNPVGAVPAEASVDAGMHTIVVERDGYEQATTTAVVKAGERKRVTIPLERTQPIFGRWWFWAGVGAVVVGGAVLTGALLTEAPADRGDIQPGQVQAPIRF